MDARKFGFKYDVTVRPIERLYVRTHQHCKTNANCTLKFTLACANRWLEKQTEILKKAYSLKMSTNRKERGERERKKIRKLVTNRQIQRKRMRLKARTNRQNINDEQRLKKQNRAREETKLYWRAAEERARL